MLFKTTARLVSFAKLASTVNFSNVSPTIRTVEEQHILPLLDSPLYNSLNDDYTSASDESSLTDPQKKLLEKVRNVIGPLVCYYYTPKAEVLLSDAGAQRMETGSNKTAFQNQVTNFREQNLRESEMATEQLLQFLEENKADYTDWTAGNGFRNFRSLFIKSGTEFNRFFPSHSPCRNYMAMRPSMMNVEENTIRKALGDDLYEGLKETDQASDGVFTALEKDLLLKVKSAVAYLTVAEAIPFINVRIDTNGLTVQATGARTQNDDMSSRNAAQDSALNNLRIACEKTGQAWINAIEKWKKENITAVANSSPIADTGNLERSGSFGML